MNDNVINMRTNETDEPEIPLVSVYEVTYKGGDSDQIMAEVAVGTGALIFFRGEDNHVLRVIPLDLVADLSLRDQVPADRTVS